MYTNSWTTTEENTSSQTSNIEIKKYDLSNSEILVQWSRKSKFKKFSYKTLTCYTYSKCWVNFIATHHKKSNYYRWIFWYTKKQYHWYNPKTIYFYPWFYRIKLIVNDPYWNRKVEHYKVYVKQLLKKSEQKFLKNNLIKITKYKQTAFFQINNKIKLALKNKQNKNNFLVKNINNLIKKKKSLTKKIEKTKLAFIKWKIVKQIFWKWVKKKTIVKIPVPIIKKLTLKTNTKIEKQKQKKLAKNVKLRISFQKKNLKISWITFPKKIVKIYIWKQKFKTFSNFKWKYSLKINKLIAGKYKIKVSVFDKKWMLLAQKFSKEKNITKKYIAQLNNYKYKKYLSYLKKKRKKYHKKTKIKKLKVEKINYASIIPQIKQKEKFNLKIFLINILIFIISIFSIILVLFKKKLI